MAQVEFHHKGIITTIQCQEDQKFEEICKSFLTSSQLNEKEIHYLYDDQEKNPFDKNLTFNQMANSIDKSNKKMTVLVINNHQTKEEDSIVKSKNIICPQCKEDIKMNTEHFLLV